MLLPLLSKLNFQFPITSFLIFVIFSLLIIVWLGFTLIIRYHWKNYGSGALSILTMSFIYFIGSGVLILGMGLFAFLYQVTTT